ncbi:Vacuolar protein sorting-associated protein vps5 [Exophiala dermatitidis]|uniref:Vacuolar protein sorting-associated protein vps5 n=1 Tax=Exophiala dermatitidis TaxID=5970 RepID=A0AAN6IWW5_EXODE|nr:Vacuolar protein sorting-associated protein vps5 [Exophiala dermatitidis]KAJ4525813.1 Vacuolar protein sorting-associated protein vps5 [Exophiala dermatitidis]KAJ4527242.1 Vacuolar protein sorting-associated protein vps5 [Exophiala dermatitidis]KAJ4532969.1 Vacuolar protein sorting-associated protein vps5 [Exophiala dermatitidis]KAJ4538760.1 Vacuolar protein sorting-associated protein vps5 [Exophiala dermatitidis]
MDMDSPWGDVPSKSQSDELQDSTTSSSKENDATNSATSTRTSTGGPRPSSSRKIPARKIEVQPTKLEAVDDSLDPLGPLGGDTAADTPPLSADQAPTPPKKEANARVTRQPSATSSGFPASEYEDTTMPIGRAKPPPPVQPQSGAGPARQTQPSISIEQAAKPTFQISVGDPHKVGDLATSHIVYQVRTKTTSKAYKQPEFAVTRRYRDFLWLYNSLHNNNPGVVVPPPPEKQAVGRFDSEFVESRRQALERMLNKIAAHPILHHDPDLKIFLESESFNLDVKNKENREPDLGQNKGMLSSLGINVGGSSGKFVEHDDWFHDRKIYLDALESQLKSLMKALDAVVVQRKGLAEAAGEYASSLSNLAQVELSPVFSGPLHGLSAVQLRIQELYERQAQQDVLTLGITIDEYIRLIGSVKQAFSQRQKAFHSWHAAESELAKRRTAHEKLLRQGKSQQDKLNEVSASVSDAEKRAHQARLLFEDMGRLMRGELERFEREKVEDFKSGVETFLEGAVEAQKELIELWETFLLQMDAEDEAPINEQPAPQEPATEGTQAGSQAGGSTEETGAPATATDVALEQEQEA